MKIIDPKDAINRRQDEGLIIRRFIASLALTEQSHSSSPCKARNALICAADSISDWRQQPLIIHFDAPHSNENSPKKPHPGFTT